VTGFLASVATLEEMEVARAGGVDIVDLKDPAHGALGAWDAAALQKAVPLWWSWPEPKPLLSATAGDRPMEPGALLAAVERVASRGAPMIKLGIFPGGDPLACFAALRDLAVRTDLVAVFFADAAPDFDLLPEIAAAGFAGAMVDTADKSSGGLRRHLGDAELAAFVRRARALGLTTGLAGSLRLEDVGPLAALDPDYLGFRGALCAGARTGRVTEAAVSRIRSAIDARRRSL
jgi:(5-formylfuran-3-yl)methyl phosphate synthase